MNKRLTFPAAAAIVAVILPVVALAQMDSSALPMDNSSNTIGLLVAWLLAGGGIISAIIATGVDKSLRSKR